MSEEDIQAGRTIDQFTLNESELEWQKKIIWTKTAALKRRAILAKQKLYNSQRSVNIALVSGLCEKFFKVF
jgi:hypothetical protein